MKRQGDKLPKPAHTCTSSPTGLRQGIAREGSHGFPIFAHGSEKDTAFTPSISFHAFHHSVAFKPSQQTYLLPSQAGIRHSKISFCSSQRKRHFHSRQGRRKEGRQNSTIPVHNHYFLLYAFWTFWFQVCHGSSFSATALNSSFLRTFMLWGVPVLVV